MATVAGALMILAGSGFLLAEVLAVGREPDSARAFVGAVFFVLGCPLVAWPLLRKTGIVEDPNQPWVTAMARLAAEHGQQVVSDGSEGAWFDMIHGGPRFTVQVQPAKGLLTLACQRAARHGVVVVRRGETPEGDRARWGELLRGAAWSMRAEVRVASLPLAESKALHRALDRFYTFPGARAVHFAGEGLRLELELPHPDITDRVVRNAAEAAREVWGAWSA